MEKLLQVSIVLCVAIVTLSHGQPIFYGQPEQIHLSYGRDERQMVVTWSTLNDTTQSVVKYGNNIAEINNQVVGSSYLFTDGGSEKRRQYIHTVTLTGLAPGKMYVYRCGSSYGWSDVFYFTTMKSGRQWSPRLVMFGDLGNVNAQSLARLQTEIDQYDAVLHIGDFAYNMDDDNARVGDAFMNQIQSIAAYLPYMTCPGNHESAANFSNYKNRFTMPRDESSDNMFYSFDIGPAHVISFSTEFYFFTNEGMEQIFVQQNWLEEELERANLPENRAEHPWIITMAHRPMYCSNLDNDDCTHQESLIRVALERTFNQYGVDLQLWAHEHSYERLWPVYNKQVYNGSILEPYTDPQAPVHVVTGSAGCSERHDNFDKNPGPWSAFRSLDYGYTRMTIHNGTHISFEQVSDDKDGQIVDSFTLIKNSHGPFTSQNR